MCVQWIGDGEGGGVLCTLEGYLEYIGELSRVFWGYSVDRVVNRRTLEGCQRANWGGGGGGCSCSALGETRVTKALQAWC